MNVTLNRAKHVHLNVLLLVAYFLVHLEWHFIVFVVVVVVAVDGIAFGAIHQDLLFLPRLSIMLLFCCSYSPSNAWENIYLFICVFFCCCCV